MLTIRFDSFRPAPKTTVFQKRNTESKREEEEEEAENECPTAANDLVAQTVVQLSSSQILLPFTINSIRPMLLRSAVPPTPSLCLPLSAPPRGALNWQSKLQVTQAKQTNRNA